MPVVAKPLYRGILYLMDLWMRQSGSNLFQTLTPEARDLVDHGLGAYNSLEFGRLDYDPSIER